MKKVKVDKWIAKSPDGGDVEEDIIMAFTSVLSNATVKGMDSFKMFTRLGDAFEKADKTGELELEDADYQFLKETLEKNIPPQWGMNKDITRAINNFIKAGETHEE